MRQKPFTQTQLKALVANRMVDEMERKPIVKFFSPWGSATWLISELDDDGDTMFGLCDLGLGYPEIGYVSLNELRKIKGPFGLTIERDLHFTADKTLTEYAEEASKKGRISA